ncbi:MAG: hypothetical protein ACKVWV_13280 [Planctomycetota bacterium]
MSVLRGIVCALLACVAHAQSNRAWPAEIEITGPAASIVLSMGDAGRTLVDGALARGETRRLEVHLPAMSASMRFTPTIEFDARGSSEGRVRFVDWIDRASVTEALPPGLRARARPPVERGRVRPSVSALCLCAAALVLGVSLRRRPRVVAALAIGCAAGVYVLPPDRDLDAIAHATVYEIAGGAPLALRVDASFAWLELPPAGRELAVEVLPVNVPVEWRVSLTDGGRKASSPSARFYRLELLDAGARRIARDDNEWGPLSEVWTRFDGDWVARGAWNPGTALPAGAARDAPPGWLAAGLPQGVDVLLARARDEDAYLRVIF